MMVKRLEAEAQIVFFRVSSPEAFDRTPEFAMGFHFGMRRRSHGAYVEQTDQFLVLNGTLALSVELLERANMPSAAGQLPPSMFEATVAIEPCEDVPLFLAVAGLPETIRRRMQNQGHVHGPPPFVGQSRNSDRFVRFSAFVNDRRVGQNGDLLPGTFATSLRDADMVPTALTAVGHYALPSILPPTYRFDIVPPPLTGYHFGTVAPAFGQSGGGTEIEFFTGVGPGSVSGPSMIPYL